MFMAAMAMVLPWKIVENFPSFLQKYETLALSPSLSKSVSCQEMGLKSSHWSCLEACFKGYTFFFETFTVRPSIGAQRSHERAPKNVQMTLKDQSFVNKFKVLFMCIPEDVRPWNLGKCLKCLRGNLSTQKYFFTKNFELPAKFRGVQSKSGRRYFLPLSPLSVGF
jgi:hypothetical protein